MPVKTNKQTGSLEHYRGNEELIERLHDYMDQVERTYQPIITSFLTPAMQEAAIRYLGKQIVYRIDGGYEGAENCRLKLFPPYTEVDDDMQIVLLKAKISLKFEHISHRDVLGALMNLGIKRDVFGDILIEDDAVYVFVSEHIATYVIDQLTKIRHTGVCFEYCDDVIQKKEVFQEITRIVSSLRADVVISSCINLSRAKVKEMIQKGLVKINHVILEQCDRMCNNNSTISIRGYGRFLFVGSTHTTKKGNWVITIRKLK